MAGPVKNGRHVAPDGGWGWAVCFASFMLQALTIGITYTFGIIFVDLLEYFESGESETAWIGSIQPALLYFTGITAGPLLLRFGWRIITMVGAVMSCLGFVASAFAPQIWVLYLTYGVLTGIGNGLMYVTSMVSVQHYFDKKRAMATGLAVSGSGVGTLVFGIVMQQLLDAVGWRVTLIINGIVCLVVGVSSGALYRPLPEITDEQNSEDSDDSSDDDLDEKSLLTASGKKRSFYGTQSPRSSFSGLSGKSSKSSALPTHTEHNIENKELVSVESSSGCCSCCPGSACISKFCQILGEIFDPSLFKNPIFVLFTISLLGFSFGYHTPYTYVPERAVHLGIGTTKASLLISIMGVSNVAARLIFGWIADRSEGIRFWFAGVVFCLSGVFTVLVFLYETYPAMVAYSIVFGACSGCFASLFPVILVDLLGVEIIEKSLGQSLACASFAFLFASPMSGWIIDQTGDYDVPFMVVGGMEIAGGLLYFLIKCFIPRYGYKPPVITMDTEDDKGPVTREAMLKAVQARVRERTRSRMISETFT